MVYDHVVPASCCHEWDCKIETCHEKLLHEMSSTHRPFLKIMETSVLAWKQPLCTDGSGISSEKAVTCMVDDREWVKTKIGGGGLWMTLLFLSVIYCGAMKPVLVTQLRAKVKIIRNGQTSTGVKQAANIKLIRVSLWYSSINLHRQKN